MDATRRAIWLAVVLGFMPTALVACHSSTPSQAAHLTTVSPAHRRAPFTLSTHCGIQWADIDGGFWRNFHPPSDGIVNTPNGWNILQRGTLIYIDGSTVKFESSAGSAVFHLVNIPPKNCA